jgi:hypothetical protein
MQLAVSQVGLNSIELINIESPMNKSTTMKRQGQTFEEYELTFKKSFNFINRN